MQEFLVLNLVKSKGFNTVLNQVSEKMNLAVVEVCDKPEYVNLILVDISSIDALNTFNKNAPTIGITYSQDDLNLLYQNNIFLSIPENISLCNLEEIIKKQFDIQGFDLLTTALIKNKSYAFKNITNYIDTVFMNITLGIAFLTKELDVLIINPMFSTFFHNIYNESPELGDKIHRNLNEKNIAFWNLIIQKSSSFKGENTNLQGKWDDDKKHYQIQITPILKLKEVIGYAIMIKDISEFTNANADLKRYYNYLLEQNSKLERAYKELDLNNKKLKVAYEKVNALSNHDYLTQAPNRKYFLEKIEYEQLRFKRTRIPFILVYADIDDFKKVNDDYGHETGDYVLISLANLVKTTIRNIDFFCRWGGEEFLIFLAETDLTIGKTIVERILSEIRNHEFNYNGKTLKVTMTFGLAIYEKDQHINEIIDIADKMLYWGKKHNKNQVVSSIPADKI